MKIRRISISALLIAICYILTTFVSFPLFNGTGYLNLSDFMIAFATIALDYKIGLIVALIAPALSDLTLGYSLYIPFTIISKSLEVILIYFLYSKNLTKTKYILVYFSCIVMASIYIIPDYLTIQNWIQVFINFGFNCLQGVVGVTLAILIDIFLKKRKVKLG